jgi:LPS-assembly lipoprotein
MWSHDQAAALGRLIRLATAVAIAGSTAACFQPLYGDKSLTGGSAVQDAMASVDVVQIKAPKGTPLARIAVETRNELLFGLTGGSGGYSPTHKLNIHLSPTASALIVDTRTGRNEFENYGLDASYTLTELATGKAVITGNAIARVSYDIPGQQQRFAKARGLRDGETRAARLIAEQIKARLASYFMAGT